MCHKTGKINDKDTTKTSQIYDEKNLTKEQEQVSKERISEIRQTSSYSDSNKPRINNNHFFEERSNPLGSKGN